MPCDPYLSLQGRLILPTNANFSVLLVHSNRCDACTYRCLTKVCRVCSLSCTIHGNNVTAKVDQNLLLPGNAFSAPLPRFATMRNVKFLSVPDTWWKRWRDTVIEALLGLLLLCTMVIWWKCISGKLKMLTQDPSKIG